MRRLTFVAIVALCAVLAGCKANYRNEALKVSDKFSEAYLEFFAPEEFITYCAEDYAEQIREQVIEPRNRHFEFYDAIHDRMLELKLNRTFNEEISEFDPNYAIVVYDVISETEPLFQRECTVYLTVDGDGKWKVTDCDFSIF